MVAIFVMTTKLANLSLLKIKVFWNFEKPCDVIISVHNATKKISSCGTNYIVHMVMSPRYGDSSTANIRVDEDVLIKTNKLRLGYTSSRFLQDVFKTPSRRLFKTSCHNVLKTSSRRLGKTSWRGELFWRASVKDCFRTALHFI